MVRCPTTCRQAVREHGLVVCAVLRGNRNFEGRIHPQVRANYLASPPLVVAYALAGIDDIDLTTEPLGTARMASRSISRILAEQRGDSAGDAPAVTPNVPLQYAKVFEGDERWRALPVPTGAGFEWDQSQRIFAVRRSSKICRWSRRCPPNYRGTRLAMLGDSITTDHISPAGGIRADSPAGKYLIEQGSSRKTSIGTAPVAAITKS